MYQLYIANKNYSSWSLRPWVLMKVLNIPFEEKLVPFSGTSNYDEFRVFTPNAKVPCLYDDKQVIWDSLAICEYLAESHQGVWPTDKSARAWARCVAAEMHSGFEALRTYCSMSIGVRIKLFAHPPELLKDIARMEEIWQQGLAQFGGPFMAGDSFTAADAFYAPVVFRFQTFNIKLTEQSSRYCQHILSMPAIKQWQTDAHNEVLRDREHDQYLTEYGETVADYRKI